MTLYYMYLKIFQQMHVCITDVTDENEESIINKKLNPKYMIKVKKRQKINN